MQQLPVILVSTLPAQCLPSIRLLVIHRLLRLGGCALLLLREGTLQGRVEVLIRMAALVVERRLVPHLVVVLHRVTSRGGRGSRGGAASCGGRGATTSQRPATGSTANQPNARTISELRRLAFYTKGDFPDIDHKTDCVSFVEYAYAVKTTKPNVPHNFLDGMKLADADLWKVAAENEVKSFQDLNVYSLVPRSTVPPGKKVISGYSR